MFERGSEERKRTYKSQAGFRLSASYARVEQRVFRFRKEVHFKAFLIVLDLGNLLKGQAGRLNVSFGQCTSSKYFRPFGLKFKRHFLVKNAIFRRVYPTFKEFATAWGWKKLKNLSGGF